MVKGVNKQIIEINNTGNSYFERVLLFVAPGKCDKSTEELKREAESYLLNLSSDFKVSAGLRQHCKNKKKRKMVFLSVLSLLVIITAVTMIVLNFV